MGIVSSRFSRRRESTCSDSVIDCPGIYHQIEGELVLVYIIRSRESLSLYISSDRGRACSDWWEVIGRSFCCYCFYSGY